MIAIEYTRSPEYVLSNPHRSKDSFQPTKSLSFARERENDIVITVVVWNGSTWVPFPEVALPRTNYLDRTKHLYGYVAIRFYPNRLAKFADHYSVPDSDYADEIGALLGMLSALQCSNVSVERSDVSKARKAMLIGKRDALPFDSYNVLTINSSYDDTGITTAATGGHHRSPREHLRRGHIRRLVSGRRIWVNATVVAAGRGTGVVSKDYKMCFAERKPNCGADSEAIE